MIWPLAYVFPITPAFLFLLPVCDVISSDLHIVYSFRAQPKCPLLRVAFADPFQPSCIILSPYSVKFSPEPIITWNCIISLFVYCLPHPQECKLLWGPELDLIYYYSQVLEQNLPIVVANKYLLINQRLKTHTANSTACTRAIGWNHVLIPYNRHWIREGLGCMLIIC